MITIPALGNQLAFMIFAASFNPMIKICNLPTWLPMRKVNEEVSREGCKL